MPGVLTPPQNNPINLCDIYFFSFTMIYCHFNKKKTMNNNNIYLYYFLHLNLHVCIPCHLIRLHPPWLFSYSKPKISVSFQYLPLI